MFCRKKKGSVVGWVNVGYIGFFWQGFLRAFLCTWEWISKRRAEYWRAFYQNNVSDSDVGVEGKGRDTHNIFLIRVSVISGRLRNQTYCWDKISPCLLFGPKENVPPLIIALSWAHKIDPSSFWYSHAQASVTPWPLGQDLKVSLNAWYTSSFPLWHVKPHHLHSPSILSLFLVNVFPFFFVPFYIRAFTLISLTVLINLTNVSKFRPHSLTPLTTEIFLRVSQSWIFPNNVLPWGRKEWKVGTILGAPLNKRWGFCNWNRCLFSNEADFHLRCLWQSPLSL